MSARFGSKSTPQRSHLALRFFALTASLMLAAFSLSSSLLTLAHSDDRREPLHFSPAFAVTTLLLFGGSAALVRAVAFVKREKQTGFRRSLIWALGCGTLFVGIQTYALSQLIRQQPAEDVPTGAGAFVAVLATLHAMHFVVALFCLVFITVQAFADRYDHEYHWGVIFCAWFWHALGLAWCAVLATMLITML